jgi:hypothetical protein
MKKSRGDLLGAAKLVNSALYWVSYKDFLPFSRKNPTNLNNLNGIYIGIPSSVISHA